MKINRVGNSRMVIEFKSFVVKMPYLTKGWGMFLLGKSCNRTEWLFSEANKGNDHIVPALRSFGRGLFVVFPKVVITTPDTFDHSRVLKEYVGAGDDHCNNYGFLNGRMVLVDYGYIKRPEKNLELSQEGYNFTV